MSENLGTENYPITPYQMDSFKLATVYGFTFVDASITGHKENQAMIIRATKYANDNKIREKISTIESRGDTIPIENKLLYQEFKIEKHRDEGFSGLKRLKALNALYNMTPTTTLGEVITNIAGTIIPNIPVAHASGLTVPLLPRLSISNITEINKVFINSKVE